MHQFGCSIQLWNWINQKTRLRLVEYVTRKANTAPNNLASSFYVLCVDVGELSPQVDFVFVFLSISLLFSTQKKSVPCHTRFYKNLDLINVIPIKFSCDVYCSLSHSIHNIMLCLHEFQSPWNITYNYVLQRRLTSSPCALTPFPIWNTCNES